MTTRRPFVKAANGLVHITATDLDFDEIEQALAEYRAADKLADEDWDARRLTRHAHQSRPAADSAADDVRHAAGIQLDWETALRFSDEVAQAAAYARKQATKLTNPMLREA
jgi:hypothetical protein